ncbi:MAG TPA: hypothetical protein VIE35_03750 [Dongiaceae bacterium]
MAKLSLTGIAAIALCLAAGAAAAQDKDWPCEQVLQPQLSIGSMWSGPDPTAARVSWENDEAVKTLVVRVAPRRVPLDEAKEEIRRFALGITGDRQKLLTEVFAGLFDTINMERSSIIRGIKRYRVRQAALAKVIEDKTSALDDIDPASEDQAVAQKRLDMQNELNWDTRIFDDRQRLLPAVCGQPVLLEQRLYQLSHAVMDDMDVK